MGDRTEKDALGGIVIADDALWGSSTERARNNFQISGVLFPKEFIQILAVVKKFAAEENCELSLLDKNISRAICEAADEIANGLHFDEFPLDVFQTGSGTSTNMNANEVIANLANIKLGHRIGEYSPVHPNDHVNMGQSSNDVMPSVLHITSSHLITTKLLPALKLLQRSLEKKSVEFKDVVKVGRTHMTDAMPITLGQEFSGFAAAIAFAISNLELSVENLKEIALGGTAVGTGFGTHPKFAEKVTKKISKHLGLEFRPAKNFFEAMSSRTRISSVSGAVKVSAISIGRIADDIRLLSSGPRQGFGEITLPALQPGSSIMPGKINPVAPEVAIQVAMQVAANDVAISNATLTANLELNTCLPIIVKNMIESINITANAARTFAEKCVDGINANVEKCREGFEKNLALATVLAPKIGYAKAAEIAKKAYSSGKTIRQVALEEHIVGEEELEKLFDLKNIITS